ncbi:helix-turn-helix domain-containing protein [Streptomyces sp. NPDC059373]
MVQPLCNRTPRTARFATVQTVCTGQRRNRTTRHHSRGHVGPGHSVRVFSCSARHGNCGGEGPRSVTHSPPRLYRERRPYRTAGGNTPCVVSGRDHLSIGERVAFYRKRRGYTQEVLAGQVGRSTDWLAKAESGRRKPPRIDMLAELARILRVPLGDVVGY